MARGVLIFGTRTVKTVGHGWKLSEYEIQDPWYEVDFDGLWTAAFRLAIQRGRTVVSELRIFPTDDRREPEMAYEGGKWSAEDLGPDVNVPPGGVTSQIVRHVPFDSLSAVSEIVEWIKVNRPEEWGSLTPSRLTDDLERHRPGPKGPADEELVEYVLEYLDLCDKDTQNPHTVLSRRHDISHHRSKHLIDTARDRSLLSSPESGRAGGALLPRGEEVRRKMKRVRRKGTR